MPLFILSWVFFRIAFSNIIISKRNYFPLRQIPLYPYNSGQVYHKLADQLSLFNAMETLLYEGFFNHREGVFYIKGAFNPFYLLGGICGNNNSSFGFKRGAGFFDCRLDIHIAYRFREYYRIKYILFKRRIMRVRLHQRNPGLLYKS